MAFELPALNFAHTALEGLGMSTETLELHHDKHHDAYVTALNGFVERNADLQGKSLEEIITATYGVADREGIFNQAGQHWNHIHFWNALSPNGGGIPGTLEAKLIDSFGSVDKFKEEFSTKGGGQFGSGWVWLVKDTDGGLKVTSTENGVNPICFDQTALLGCDVWEHSYYIDFRNKRPAYLSNFLDKLVNWEDVASRM